LFLYSRKSNQNASEGIERSRLKNKNLHLTAQIDMSTQKSLAERQAIIDKIKKTQTDDFLREAIAAGLNPAFDLAWTDLSGVNLSGADLQWTDLEGVNFKDANFRDRRGDDAKLKGAFLRGAFLSGVGLVGINLDYANLSFADFSNAHLRYTGLRGANLQYANLTNADLDGANLGGTNLKNANFSSANLRSTDDLNWSLEGAYLAAANLSRADMEFVFMNDACLVDADMEGVYFKNGRLNGANLKCAYLVDANLAGTQLEYANLVDADLSGANLSGTSLVHANLSGACLVDANLQGADLTRADLRGADLSGANLSGAYFVGADLSGATLGRANFNNTYLNCADLRFANLVGANLLDAKLTEADLSGATLDDNCDEYPRKAEELTDETKALVPVIREKWKALATKFGQSDRQQSANSIKAIYALLGKPEPEIIFCDSPVVALRFFLSKLAANLELLEEEFGNSLGKIPKQKLWKPLLRQMRKQLGQSLSKPLENKLGNEITQELKKHLRSQLSPHLWELVVSPLGEENWTKLGEGIWRKVSAFLDNCICPESLADIGALFDFQISVLNARGDTEHWKAFESIVSNCGWLFTFDKVCLACDIPFKINFDNEQRFHAEGEAAIKFADGYSLYYYHGVSLPEKYGKVRPQHWQTEWYLEEPNIQLRRILIEVIPSHKLQASWLLHERNAELRRNLIQKIGYARVCQELQAIELDTYFEYALLKIDADVDAEPVYILKMTCPSTGSIHALRVPPNMPSAREAICWVNWGIAPEEFSVQT
jgi:uncharacterized protein YjbI with pentapeptide repeats